MNAPATHKEETKAVPPLNPANGQRKEAAPAAKPKAEAKPAKEKAPKAERAPRESALRKAYPDNGRIVIATEGGKNPKRAGAKAYERFELYKTSKTVADFIKAGGLYADLSWDVGHGFVRVEVPAQH